MRKSIANVARAESKSRLFEDSVSILLLNGNVRDAVVGLEERGALLFGQYNQSVYLRGTSLSLARARSIRTMIKTIEMIFALETIVTQLSAKEKVEHVFGDKQQKQTIQSRSMKSPRDREKQLCSSHILTTDSGIWWVELSVATMIYKDTREKHSRRNARLVRINEKKVGVDNRYRLTRMKALITPLANASYLLNRGTVFLN